MSFQSKTEMSWENKGVLEVSLDIIRDSPALVARIFADIRLVVIRAENLYERNTVRYQALSPHFELCHRHGVAPIYTINITRDEYNAISDIEVVKVDDGIGITVSKAESLRSLRKIDA